MQLATVIAVAADCYALRDDSGLIAAIAMGLTVANVEPIAGSSLAVDVWLAGDIGHDLVDGASGQVEGALAVDGDRGRAVAADADAVSDDITLVIIREANSLTSQKRCRWAAHTPLEISQGPGSLSRNEPLTC